MRRVWFVTAVLFAVAGTVPLGAQGPTGTILGRVVDDATQQPLAGAIVGVATRSVLTQADGRYVLTAVPVGTHTVRVRMLGYAPTEQSVTIAEGESVTLDVAMTAQAIGLSAVVVTGYGEQRAGDITGAVSQVSSEQFNTGRVIAPAELIQSKVAGVQVVDNNDPGGGRTIRIRGATSVNASSDPLYVVDGMPVAAGAGGGLSAGRDPLNAINPNDIESITVLRDASAAAIYGANAANGVVLITTKKGQGRPQFEYSVTTSASVITRRPDMLNAAQFRTAVETYAPQHTGDLLNANTDWFDHVTRTAFGQDHNLAVSGVGETVNWRLSLGYLNQDGIVQGSTTERLALGLSLQQQLFDNRLEVRANIKGSRADDQFTPGGVLSNAAQMGPTQPVTDPTNLTGFYEWPDSLLTSPDNPVAIVNLASDRGRTYRSIGNLLATYRLPFVEGLRANVNLGYDVTRVDRAQFRPSVLHDQYKTGTDGFIRVERPYQTNTALETYLNYGGRLSAVPGTIDLTGGYSYSESDADYSRFEANGLTTDLLGANGYQGARESNTIPDPQRSRLISVFGRANYNFDDRYLAAVSLRRDGSSRFGSGNAWGTFPSVAVAWRISREPFLASVGSLSDLKMRVSWARTGNQAFANYQQYATYLVGDGRTQAQFGNEFVTTIRPAAVDRNIKWESTQSVNVGLDFGFANQRFSGAIDWYNKKTDDLIFTVPIAAGTNFSNFVTTNIGSMKNRGIEFNLSAQVLRPTAGGLSWTADVTAAHNTNELVSINPFAGGAQEILVGGVAGGVGTRIQVLRPGVPINSFFVYEHRRGADGRPVFATGAGADTLMYVDQDGDGIITVADRRPYKDPAPKWILGHSSYFTYGNFDLGFTVRAYLGNYVYNNVASNLGTYAEVGRGKPYNLHASVLETGFETPQYLSDYYVEDASFLRMDNITLGYRFNYAGRPFRAFGTIQSAFTITGYSGVDPTAGLIGIDNNIYPRSRTFTGGLSVRF